MNKTITQDGPDSPNYKAFMTVLFVGIVDTVLCLIFNIIYRSNSIYFSSNLINVSTLIFGVLFLFALMGIVYIVMLSRLEGGTVYFMVLCILLTALALWGTGSVNYSARTVESERFRGLLRGIIWIIGISAIVGIPLLRSIEIFDEYVL